MKLSRFPAAILVCAAVLTAADPAAPPPVAQRFLGLFEQLRNVPKTKTPVSFQLPNVEINAVCCSMRAMLVRMSSKRCTGSL